MTGWAVNSIVKAIKGSSPFLPIYNKILYNNVFYHNLDPNAGIGRQDNLKIYWYLS
jgi:hypothetical protein